MSGTKPTRTLPQPSLRTRRQIAMLFTLCITILFAWMIQQESMRLGRADWISGFTVLVCLFLLMLLGVRRRIPFLPLGKVSTWTQIHLYVGIFTAVIYAMHVPMLIAGGFFERVLSILFLTTTASGFYGLYASRTLPRKLTSVENEHRFDQIGWGRRQIADAAKQIHDALPDGAAREVLVTFYRRTLSPFFAGRPSLAYVVVPSGNRRRRLLGDLKELDRYLETDSRKAVGQFAALVRRRDDLDYQFALQFRLRCWVVVHSFCSLLLLVAAVVHAVIAVRFTL